MPCGQRHIPLRRRKGSPHLNDALLSPKVRNVEHNHNAAQAFLVPCHMGAQRRHVQQPELEAHPRSGQTCGSSEAVVAVF